ncbi:unnamed protein product [Rotaria magnacalcarata]|uniref:Uncharacterized protein n=2 Tax=Rotaria magnacalcarata TaxID=392030 RepID=A0A819V2R3_9BILA|nr:unnamed protein product [Rotaria magnacalcarata]
MLININEINTDLNFIWKIHATVTSVYPKRNYTNSHSVGEISCWDLKDNSGSITLAAFNLNSHIMSDLLQMNQTYEFSNLSVRLASDSFKTLAHSYQLVCTNTTVATQITSTPYDETPTFNFVHLIQIPDLPLNSIIDVQANVVRDFGISTGVRNVSVWTRRYLHITQDGIQTGLTLWNDQARLIDHNMTGLQIKLKNVKISSFDDDLLDESFLLLRELLNNLKSINDTDPIGTLLSLFASVGYLATNSTVTISNQTTNLNIFVLLIGPSGSGKTKIIGPVKRSIINTMKALNIPNENYGIIDDFTIASLTLKLAKSNAFIMSDEAEKPLLTLGFYSPFSDSTAADRIAGCKFFGTVPTTKDTMTYHLEVSSHLSFLGATTGRLWNRLIDYYLQGNQTDGFSERFLHYTIPKKNDLNSIKSQTLDYHNDNNDDNDDSEEDISDDEYGTTTAKNMNQNQPSLTQILIVCRLLGDRIFTLSRHGTKKFNNKIRQYQELAQHDDSDDINYASRIGKAAEILCKIAGISQIVKISLEILQILKDQNQLLYDDTSLNFIRNTTQLIENKYPSANLVLEIQSSSTRLAGYLFCNYLRKMFIELYNTSPLLPNELSTRNQILPIQTSLNTIREYIFEINQLFFLKRDLTGPMGVLRRFPTDLVNTALDELINYEFIRKGYSNTTTINSNTEQLTLNVETQAIETTTNNSSISIKPTIQNASKNPKTELSNTLIQLRTPSIISSVSQTVNISGSPTHIEILHSNLQTLTETQFNNNSTLTTNLLSSNVENVTFNNQSTPVQVTTNQFEDTSETMLTTNDSILKYINKLHNNSDKIHSNIHTSFSRIISPESLNHTKLDPQKNQFIGSSDIIMPLENITIPTNNKTTMNTSERHVSTTTLHNFDNVTNILTGFQNNISNNASTSIARPSFETNDLSISNPASSNAEPLSSNTARAQKSKRRTKTIEIKKKKIKRK